MGCCISKCKPKIRNPPLNPTVEDKTVISQSPPPRKPPPTVQSPPSSFTCSTQSTNSYGSSSFSSASSCSSVTFNKAGGSFSNHFLESCMAGYKEVQKGLEFSETALQTCIQENQRIVGLDPIKKSGEMNRSVCGISQKRARASSPTLTRQKSFRVEKERSANVVVNGKSIVRSPSPSRRFNGRPPTNRENERHRLAKENIMPPFRTGNGFDKERRMCLKNENGFGHGIGSKVEVAKMLSKVKYSGAVAMEEDIDNPHIALDCFIFL